MKRVGLLAVILSFWLVQIIVSQDQVVLDIVNLINAERELQGVNPLYVNDALMLAAQRHSDDMANGEFLSHTGTNGSEFWERMAEAGYVMMAGAENVQSRNDLNAVVAYDLWRNSLSHYENMINPEYREIGLAYAQSASGTYYFTMLLGNRADFSAPIATVNAPTAQPIFTILPPTLPPAPTLEPTAIVTATPIIPTSTLIPTNTIIPPTLTPTVDSNIVAMNELQLQGLLSLLLVQPDELNNIVQATPTQSVVEQPSEIPPTLTPLPQFEVQLIYDGDSFTLINNADTPLYLEGLYFESASGALAVERWNTEFLSASLAQFPAQGCLQVWGLGYSSPLLPPNACGVRHAWIAVNDSGAFWQGVTSFDVYRFGEWVTTCTVIQGECLFNLSDRADVTDVPSDSIQTNTQQSNFPADIRLIYSQDSFTVLNTFGANLDITGLGFASASGTVSISQWNTEFLTRPLNDFPTGDCLQAWGVNLPEYPPRPAECNFRHAWIGLADSQLFWTNTDFFTVSRNGSVLATCTVSVGVCDIDLP